MDFMNNSVDISVNSPILQFLENNLEKIVAETDSIQKTIEVFLDESEEVLKEIADLSNGVEIRLLGRKLFYEKYAIWFHVKNKKEQIMVNFNLSLHWNSNDVLVYVTSVHPVITPETKLNSPFIYQDESEDEALMVILVDRPIFNEELSIKINGFLSYHDDKGNIYVDDIPEVTIGASDINDTSVNLSPIQRDDELIIFYTRLICSWKFDLVMELAEDEQIIDVLENAGFDILGPGEHTLQRFYTISEKSPLFDGIIIEITDVKNRISDISVYSKHQNSMFAFVHYLYQQIQPVIILPAEYKERIPLLLNSDLISEIQECMSEEINLLKYIASEEAPKDTEYQCMRNELTYLEYKTDLAYLKLLVAEDVDETVNSDEKLSEE